MVLINKFNVGEIVAFKTHPLLYKRNIQGDGKLVPPFMVVKEVLFESKKKKLVDSSNGKTISERIKYLCLFFDDNRNDFKEVMIYESMLENYTKFYIARMDGEKKEKLSKYDSLIEEVSKYKIPKYEYGKLVCFKTKKLELFKKRTSVRKKVNKSTGKVNENKIIQYVVNYSTPDLVICGFKLELQQDLFYQNGDPKKLVPKEYFKVKWFNSNQMKFSEQFLPSESLVDKNKLFKG